MVSFSIFAANSTNIFPMANTRNGGQLVTEYNLRALDSVSTDPSVRYMIGPSYTHSLDDFKLSVDPEDATKLRISGGSALVNGHFVESLVEYCVIDISDVPSDPSDSEYLPSNTRLYVGLKASYNPNMFLSGALTGALNADQNSDACYKGIQLVIATVDNFKLPQDVPEDASAVTAHLLLGTINLSAGTPRTVSGVENNPDKCKYIPAERVFNASTETDNSGSISFDVNPDKLYVVSGNGVAGHSPQLADACDSLIVWDKSPKKPSTDKPTAAEAEFRPTEIAEGEEYARTVELVMPHKQVSGLRNSSGATLYYPDKSIEIPAANFYSNTPGVVNKAYNDVIRGIRDSLLRYQALSSGTFRKFIPIYGELDEESGSVDTLPTIQPSWKPGDYVVVGQDYTIELVGSASRRPSTMYILGANDIEFDFVPCSEYQLVQLYAHVNNLSDTSGPYRDHTTYNSEGYQAVLTAVSSDSSVPGICQSAQPWSWFAQAIHSRNTPHCTGGRYFNDPDHPPQYEWLGFTGSQAKYNAVDLTKMLSGTSAILWKPTQDPNYLDPEVYNTYTPLQWANDLFPVSYRDWVCIKNVTGSNTEFFFYGVSNAVELSYSDPVLVTGEIQLASSQVIGGFLNPDMVSTNENGETVSLYGQGYVVLDPDTGYLKLADFDVLSSGVLAYQLGSDIEVAAGLSSEDIQLYLDEYVNARVAFPTLTTQVNKLRNNEVMNHLDVTIPLNVSEESEDGTGPTIYISNIDSRFGTSVNLKFTGAVTDKTTIVLENCARVRIDPSIEGSPNIQLINSCLYYDASILSRMTLIRGLSLWHESWEADRNNRGYPTRDNMIVEGMTVTYTGDPATSQITASVANGSGANYTSLSDVRFDCGLASLTFASDGVICKVGLFVSSNLVSQTGSLPDPYITWSTIVLPSSPGFGYPNSSRYNFWANEIKVTGSVTQAFRLQQSTYRTYTTEFDAKLGGSDYDSGSGTIAFLTTARDAVSISDADSATLGLPDINPWSAGSAGLFIGGVSK